MDLPPICSSVLPNPSQTFRQRVCNYIHKNLGNKVKVTKVKVKVKVTKVKVTKVKVTKVKVTKVKVKVT